MAEGLHLIAETALVEGRDVAADINKAVHRVGVLEVGSALGVT